MPAAARLLDPSNHPGGTITSPPPGAALVATVRIDGRVAAVLGSLHACGTPQPPPHLATSPIASGSASVRIGGLPAARVTDSTLCGASIQSGSPGVSIG